jgi:predicted RNA methylase
MKLKQLQSLLEDVDGFAAPKIALEQYATGAHIAARILHTAHGLGDVEDCTVLDLGCGCGILGIAAVLMGAGHVVRAP